MFLHKNFTISVTKRSLNCAMNYLAHARLSFGNEQILVGNMISDFIKGKKKFDYPAMVQNGIMLHRMIDTFTDAHPVTKAAVQYLKPAAGPYASVFIDVVYDHFLATDKVEFPGKSLETFATETYNALDKNKPLLPERFSRMLPYMSEQNWLYNYQFEKGIENSFNNIFRRANYLEKNDAVFRSFLEHYSELQKCYNQFFPQLKAFAFFEFSKFTNE